MTVVVQILPAALERDIAALRLTTFERAVRERSAPQPRQWPRAAWCGCAKSWTRGWHPARSASSCRPRTPVWAGRTRRRRGRPKRPNDV